MKYIRVLLCSVVLIFFASPKIAEARSAVVISSQVRGKECCDSGTDKALDLQVATLNAYSLPASFALRFDALSDPHVLQVLKNSSYEKAAFLEITPSLASEAAVSYRGPIDRWYKASNAYLVGYAPADRQKIIDVYMKKYKEVFGTYPQSTVAWMIDSWSLNYLHDTYGIRVNELTREQWGTDSYTLYGGPVNVPYYPSRNWPLVPASKTAFALPVLIVRQTLTDPLYTYGDQQSSFTSQPNDYLFGQKDFSFFTRLLDNAMRNTFPKGFALLGLETSMEDKYQAEFAKQLEYVASLRDQKSIDVFSLRDLPVQFPLETEIGSLSGYVSPPENMSQHAFWINTPQYRARVIANATEVLLSDLRVYSDTLTDPYAATASSTLNAYWTIPFLFDGSRYRSTVGTPLRNRVKNFLSNLATEKRESSDFRVTQNDFSGNATGLKFPPIQLDSSIQFTYTPLAVTLSYPSEKGKVSIQFSSDKFSVEMPDGDSVENTLKDPEIESIRTEKILTMDETLVQGKTFYRPKLATGAAILSLISKYPKIFSPESSGEAVDFGASSFQVVNRRAIVMRNPVRLVIRLQDANGVATIATKEPTVSLSDTTVKSTVFTPESAHGEYYIDLTSNKPTHTTVKVNFGEKEIDLGTVTFVPNCLTDKMTCIQHPLYAVDFIRSKIEELSRKIVSV